MRCLHVISGLARAGAETALHKLVAALRGSGVESTVVSLSSGGALEADIRALGVPVESLGMARGTPPSPGALYRLAAAVRRFQPDVVHGWMYHGNLAATAAVAVARSSAPVVWSIHSSLTDIGAEKRSTALVVRLGALVSSRAARIVYVSGLSAGQHEAAGYASDRRVVIPIGFDTARFAPSPGARQALRAALGLPDGAVTIGHVARYHPLKDHENLLRAAAILAARRSEPRFILVGSGVDAANPELVRLTAAQPLMDRVLMLGERENVTGLTAGFDIATLASRAEAFPNVIGEAMACGVPVVTTDVGDAAAIVGETGRIVPPRDSAALAHAWDEMLEIGPDGRERLGRAARQRILDHFSMSSVARRYEQLYVETIAARRSRAARDRGAALRRA